MTIQLPSLRPVSTLETPPGRGMSPGRGRRPRSRLLALLLCLSLGFSLVAAVPLTASEPAVAAVGCTARGTGSDVWATPDAFYQIVTLNACAARQLSDEYANSGGYAGAIGLVVGWIPGWPSKAISALFGLRSTADFFIGQLISDCTANFTGSAKVTFINGYVQGCVRGPAAGSGGMSHEGN
ncbi:hypothetical protein [Mycetocola sp. JXN-3]|uniref:hypothetical protein n=1 Tax=Mycetocola sp. JXN-3 TaxID=2116510 RepID=UPI00165D0717|nr:hypothetical protein [Mycetocola sp. JXN-3]